MTVSCDYAGHDVGNREAAEGGVGIALDPFFAPVNLGGRNRGELAVEDY